jgi:hypothetical protein
MTIDAHDQMAILKLYAEYNRTIDAGDVSGWLMTFVDDGVFYHPSRRYSGRIELSIFITSRSNQLGTNPVAALMHWNDPIVISAGADYVQGSCRLLVAGILRETGKPEVVARGRYQDSLIRSHGGWHFKERRLELV